MWEKHCDTAVKKLSFYPHRAQLAVNVLLREVKFAPGRVCGRSQVSSDPPEICLKVGKCYEVF